MSVTGAANLLADKANLALREERGMSKRTTSAVWVKGIADMLAAEGLDVRALLAAPAIDPAALDTPGARLPTEKISRLWELAVERSGNPAIGLAQHQVARPASFDVVGYAMMSCADLRAAFERLIRYMLILSDALTMTMSRRAATDTGSPSCCSAAASAGAAAAHRVHFRHCDRLLPLDQRSRRSIRSRVELPYPAPADLAPYRAAFRCPVSFDAPATSLLFAAADMTAPLPTSNPDARRSCTSVSPATISAISTMRRPATGRGK